MSNNPAVFRKMYLMLLIKKVLGNVGKPKRNQ